MSKTPSLIPHIPILSHNNHQSTLLPDPFKILSNPTKLIPDPSKIFSDTANFLTKPSKILSDSTKLIPYPSKILCDASKILSDATKVLSHPSKILSPLNLLTGPSNILSTLLSSATNNPLTSIQGQVLNPAAKLLGLFTFPLSFSLRRFLIVGAVLLFLVGLIVTGTMLGLIIFLPLIAALSPILVPASTALFVVTSGLLSVCGFAVVVVIVVAWLVQHFFYAPNSPGSDQMLSNIKDATSST